MAASGGAQPVFIFFPVERRSSPRPGPVIDPVCGRVINPDMVAGRLLHGGVEHEFCSLECARAFANGPEEYCAP